MREEQFNHLPSQGTIYSTSRLGNHLIIGTGDYGKVFAHISNTLLQQIPLQNLPHECDIISLDAYIDAFPVLAVAFVQKETSPVAGAMQDGRGKGLVTAHLNVYSTWISTDQDSPTSTSSASSGGSRFKPTFHPKEEFHSSQFELLAQNCVTFQLDYIPYHMYHIPVLKQNGNFGNVLLLSGSDRKVHAFESDDDNLTFMEVSIRTYFPELAQTFPDVVTRLLIQPVNELTRRITLCGLETGNLLMWIVSSKFNKRNRPNSDSESESGSTTPSKSQHEMLEFFVAQTDKLSLENSSEQSLEAKLSSDGKVADDCISEGASGDSECMTESLDSLEESFEKIEHYYDGLITSIQSYTDGFSLNIIVASALSPTYVYTNVIEERFNAGSPLKFSSRWDCVECCCVQDIDRDGENEIIIGTFGCTLLVYKYMDEILPEWVIVSKKKFPSVIMAIEFVSPFLHVVTGLGLHIVEYNTSAYFSNKPAAILTPTDNESVADAQALEKE